MNVAHLIGACRPAVPTYASGGLWLGSSIDALQKEARSFVERGFRAMKTRVGPTDPERMVARVAAVREAIGPDIALMVDANQQMSVKQAIRIGRMMEEPQSDVVRGAGDLPRPCRRGGRSGPRSIRRSRPVKRSIRIAACWDAASGGRRRGHAGSAADGRPDRIPESRASVRGVSYSLCLAFVPGNEPGLLAALPGGYYLEHMPWFEALYRERIELDANGHAIVPDRPGWGFSFDPDAVRRFAE